MSKRSLIEEAKDILGDEPQFPHIDALIKLGETLDKHAVPDTGRYIIVNPQTLAIAKAVLSDKTFVLKKCDSEKDVKAEVRRFLKQYEPMWLFMPVQTGFGVSGTPDFVGCYMTRAFAIETKFGKAKSTPMQVRQQDIMEDAGAWVFRDVSELNFYGFTRSWETFVDVCGGKVVR